MSDFLDLVGGITPVESTVAFVSKTGGTANGEPEFGDVIEIHLALCFISSLYVMVRFVAAAATSDEFIAPYRGTSSAGKEFIRIDRV